jgi:hypothetical protein
MREDRPNYESLKALLKRGERRIADVLALSATNDPYYAGSKWRRRQAEWFAALFERFGRPGIHLRRLHYILISQDEPPMKPDGTPYENTESAWALLAASAANARYLNLVDPGAFIDQRNPEPIEHASCRDELPAPSVQIDEPSWTLPAISSLSRSVRFLCPEPWVSGYDYDDSDQPYLLEVWIEKSTMNDVLVPICRELGANLIPGIGFQSITNAIKCLTRVAAIDKPTRIFYISDFDPAGEGMPIATARQIEFWIGRYAPHADIKLKVLALTAEQVARYDLPRTPIKDSDLRKGDFEARRGVGATELDALEALHPGELARIVRDALKPYVDEALSDALNEAHDDAESLVEDEWGEETAGIRQQLAVLERNAAAVLEPYEQRLRALAKQLAHDLKPIDKRLNTIRRAIRTRIGRFDPELPERPEPDVDPPDEDDWLFDASREYEEQLEFYKAHRTDEREEEDEEQGDEK